MEPDSERTVFDRNKIASRARLGKEEACLPLPRPEERDHETTVRF